MRQLLPAFALLALATIARAEPPGFEVQLDVISSGFDKETCWVHPRAGVLPPGTGANPRAVPGVVLTLNKLRLTGSDVFYAINDFRSDDLGATWEGPTAHPEELGRWKHDDGTEHSICDVTPKWHAASGTLLATGQTVWYTADNRVKKVRPRHTAYSVYDPATRRWSRRKNLAMPDEPRFASCGAGSTQRYDLPDGRILLPVYFKEPAAKQLSATVVLCEFDGETLRYVEHGTEMTVPEERGLAEPSITKFGGRYFLTLRNDLAAYVAVGDDGLRFGEVKPWTFDDGEPLGSYNTQAHWVTHSDGLFLVYTRRGADNDHVFRHRAPLFIARVDPDKVQVLRETERVLVPEHGARLGNFGVTDVSPDETWVTVAEWMQTTSPNPYDWRVPASHGADNRVYAARIRWAEPNALVE